NEMCVGLTARITGGVCTGNGFESGTRTFYSRTKHAQRAGSAECRSRRGGRIVQKLEQRFCTSGRVQSLFTLCQMCCGARYAHQVRGFLHHGAGSSRVLSCTLVTGERTLVVASLVSEMRAERFDARLLFRVLGHSPSAGQPSLGTF